METGADSYPFTQQGKYREEYFYDGGTINENLKNNGGKKDFPKVIARQRIKEMKYGCSYQFRRQNHL